MKRIIAALAFVHLVILPALADLPQMVMREHKVDREPVVLCISLAKSPTSVPACFDLSQLPGRAR